MWMLALGGIFLAAAQACVFCRFPDRDLSGRLAQLCSQMEAQWKDCEVSWNFSAFALDDASLKKVTEKTHRVLRVMEIEGSLSSLLSYWKWLQKTKLPEYNREALCAPACRSHDLWEARILLLFVSGAALLLGILSFAVEYSHLQAKSDL
ncbi:sperm-egg fusion protein TMEM95 isoform X4 [Sagmatias obliquidens]|uniref:sperm-egg fusion protein TMEM95 isoform X4 n=1 Tax=Sagmatias obliquidens TaxID=3371155 RepID=UPI000F4420ED|nr:transmembrane protein 95 isoform X4 [Lagenorhynchus obliquidens]XP_030718153.1 transmembrane protein 95 isoform X4 [Globicephala melas]